MDSHFLESNLQEGTTEEAEVMLRLSRLIRFRLFHRLDLPMDEQAGQHRLDNTVDAWPEQVEIVGFPLVAFPVDIVRPRTYIYCRRIAMRNQAITQRGNGIGVLGDDLKGHVIPFVRQHM